MFKCSGERVRRERGWKDGGGVEGTGGYVDVGEVRSPGRGVSRDGRQVGCTSERRAGRFPGEKEKLKSSAESWEEGRRLVNRLKV